MNRLSFSKWAASLPPVLKYFVDFFVLFGAFILIELVCFCLLLPEYATGLGFGALWAAMLAGFILCLPRLAGRIVFGILYFPLLLWSLAQAGYFLVFNKMMWLSAILYADEGTAFLSDVLNGFPFFWWIGLALMLVIGILIIWKFPCPPQKILSRLPYLLCGIFFLVFLIVLPKITFAVNNKADLDDASRHTV